MNPYRLPIQQRAPRWASPRCDPRLSDSHDYFGDILTRLPTCRAKDLAALLPRWQRRSDFKADQRLADRLSAA